MALNTEVRKIDLNSTVDMSSFTADIHDYKGFCSTNALMLNKRLTPWFSRQKEDGELFKYTLNGITYSYTFKVNGDNFDIYFNDTLLMSISKDYYYTDVIDAFPSNMKSVTNPYESSAERIISSSLDSYGKTIQLSAYSELYGCDLYFVKVIGSTKVLVYKAGSEEGEEYSEYLFEVETGKKGVFGLYYITSEDVAKADYGIEADSVIITAYDYSNDAYFTYAKANPYFEDDIDTQYTNYNTYIIHLTDTEGNYNEINPEDTTYDFYGYEDLLGTWANYKNKSTGYSHLIAVPLKSSQIYLFNSSYYPKIQTVFGEWQDQEIDKNITVYECYRSENDTSYWWDSNSITKGSGSDIYTHEQLSPYPTYSIRLAIVKNYSKMYGQFAINYVNNVANNIGHNYKKIVYFADMELAGYTDSCMYFTYGNTKYELGIRTNTDKNGPSFEYGGIEGQYLIFNTTSYKNAYCISQSKAFCSCDDWNNRAIFVTKDYVEGYTGLINSRLNNGWAANETFDSVSTIYGSVNVNFSVDDSNNILPDDFEILYVDENYTCPPDVKYTVYFPSIWSTTASGMTLSVQGYISKDDKWTVSRNYITDTWSEPDSTGGEQNPSLMFTKYLKFSDAKYWLSQNSALYKMLTSSKLSNMMYLVFNLKEDSYTGETSDDAYQYFYINGTQYTYFAKYGKIMLGEQSSSTNASTICDTSSMQFIGYSSKYAYFYSTMDKHIYIFKGDNTMQKIASLERFNVKTTITQSKTTTSSAYLPVISSINVPSVDIVMLMLNDRVLVIYGDQACFLFADTSSLITNDATGGTFTFKNTVYSLVNTNGDYSPIPIELETEFYGDESGMTNTINNCVYLEVSNLSNTSSKGTVKIQAIGLQNGYVVEGKEKTVTLKQSDFNSVNTALIKFQPDVQECRGFKLKITSDFDISDLRIATATGALNQSKYFS